MLSARMVCSRVVPPSVAPKVGPVRTTRRRAPTPADRHSRETTPAERLADFAGASPVRRRKRLHPRPKVPSRVRARPGQLCRRQRQATRRWVNTALFWRSLIPRSPRTSGTPTTTTPDDAQRRLTSKGGGERSTTSKLPDQRRQRTMRTPAPAKRPREDPSEAFRRTRRRRSQTCARSPTPPTPRATSPRRTAGTAQPPPPGAARRHRQ